MRAERQDLRIYGSGSNNTEDATIAATLNKTIVWAGKPTFDAIRRGR